MPTWPEDVPFRYRYTSYSEPRNTGAIASPTDRGRPKTRRRFLNTIRYRRLTLILSEAEKDTLMDFIDNDIDGGTLPFTWYNPLGTGVTEEVKLVMPRDGTIIPQALDKRPGQIQRFSLPITVEIQP